MILKDIKNIFHQELDSLYIKEEVDSFFYMLIDSYYNISRIQLAIHSDLKIGDSEKILKALKLLNQQKPIQYILGETEFFGLPFKVNEHVLIPRPETEELVEWILNDQAVKPKDKLSVLDIGTGSGCIAISLAKNLPNTKVYALDVSAEALHIAKQNAKLNEVDIEFIEASILEQPIIDEEFDIIVSNPPYVRKQEKQEMKANVIDNEPHSALFVENENPLKFYKAITEFALNNLTTEGALYFEINEYLGNKMIELLADNDFKNIKLKQDIFKKDRMIKGIKN
ncbi:peptide chain release factor N(5)-glutamine methyltransferase [Flaviramulus sp. BrNp1-15]|uniref:peptide chain release factor N(5)-glutamine methyltransferase n=1 Tax=Flaviramulus sp. BrNp1-15 TaxID=2916754 RepID=UPI001EE9831A|nr:peptide chain release factor N(5)-glutamine methyltransferase [Flaviramulus sp. BrNp1-15]ULC60628.1 peptide chain release factor N(5)-glutamine methyltransferase [Flaviramulus sp. BrNp1-15]